MRIAILSVSAGAGHVRAAEAVRHAVIARGHSAEHIDAMDFVPRLFRKLYVGTYLKLVNRNPALWGFLYHASDRARPDTRLTKLRQAVERLNTRKLIQQLQRERPDAVVCTHFLPAQLLSRLAAKGQWSVPTWVVVTDFDVHALWAHSGLTGYCVASDEVAARIAERGIGGAQVVSTGIPVMPAFAAPPERTACAAALGLDPRRATLLLMSGGFGVGAIDTLAQRLLELPGDFQLVALAGRNAELLTKLRALASAHPGRLVPLGFTDTPERVMACADLAITKPGGLTTAECLALGLPLLVVSPIPGQEERNADHLLEHGAALKAHDAAGVVFRVRRYLVEPALRARLAANAAAIGRRDAAARIAALVCQ